MPITSMKQAWNVLLAKVTKMIIILLCLKQDQSLPIPYMLTQKLVKRFPELVTMAYSFYHELATYFLIREFVLLHALTLTKSRQP